MYGKLNGATGIMLLAALCIAGGIWPAGTVVAGSQHAEVTAREGARYQQGVVNGPSSRETGGDRDREPRAKMESSPDAPERRIVVLGWAEPGNYDIDEDIAGSRTIEAFSRNLAKTITTEIHANLGSQVLVQTLVGENAQRIHDHLSDAEGRIRACRALDAALLLAGKSSANPGFHYRDVTYTIVECGSGRYYRRQYTIERQEDLDTYGYETDLASMLRRFLVEMPPSVLTGRR